jgi:hypothetical protein
MNGSVRGASGIWEKHGVLSLQHKIVMCQGDVDGANVVKAHLYVGGVVQEIGCLLNLRYLTFRTRFAPTHSQSLILIHQTSFLPCDSLVFTQVWNIAGQKKTTTL